jgi:putative transposase
MVRERLRKEKIRAQQAAEHGVHPIQLTTWPTTALDGPPNLLARQDSTVTLKTSYEVRLATVYEEIGRLSTQVAWLTRKSGLDCGVLQIPLR